jgi:hypothetical protein
VQPGGGVNITPATAGDGCSGATIADISLKARARIRDGSFTGIRVLLD